ncbi:hypothetical protein [Streptomyces qinglanensis]|uniref:Uncharacterized protein n=1 Tax=Streptomyces qinglanensis TaxID=943816 RepID=A0A1H9QP43_9ACTN|nr:hypothetical protein [Streptomyces qinglanensis]SER61985.1 hypothetical protein SAMN05421870_10312 [Streptomyces qinglanensis]
MVAPTTTVGPYGSGIQAGEFPSRTRAQSYELTRKHTEAELVRMAYAGGLVNHNSPEKWRKDEIASAVVDNELRAAARSGADRPPAPAAPPKRPPVRHHHDECDKTVYGGGTCTCDLIEQYGPPSERDDY